MSITTGVSLLDSGPKLEREAHDLARVDRSAKEVKQRRSIEPNDPVIAEAVDSIKEASESIGRKIDIEWENEVGLAVITVYSEDGEKVIRKVPPEELIRSAERMKDRRAQYLDDTF